MADEQQAEPFSGSELAELRDSLVGSGKVWYSDTWIMRLLATLEAMRPLVVALAEYPDARNRYCLWCGWQSDAGSAHDSDGYQHAADCPVTQARELKERLGW